MTDIGVIQQAYNAGTINGKQALRDIQDLTILAYWSTVTVVDIGRVGYWWQEISGEQDLIDRAWKDLPRVRDEMPDEWRNEYYEKGQDR